MAKKLTYYTDNRHGWLKVPIKELIALGIEKQISKASSVRGEDAYLEQHLDMQIYYKAKGYEYDNQVHRKEFWDNVKVINSIMRCGQIRSYETYRIYTEEEKKEIAVISDLLLNYKGWTTKTENKLKKRLLPLADLQMWKAHYNL